MEDFDFEQFMDDSNDKFNGNLNDWRDRLMVNAIESNFEEIQEKGLDPVYLKMMDSEELKNLYDTLNVMIEHYVELEMYENCKLLQDHVEVIEQIGEWA
mgnify:CR=1 FL=1